ncbi:tyrosine-type recombinase/integrase [Pelagibacterium nitratireducens]|uniref:Tyrosine-type recombinase/integrase n=1 Tax=Pelagibacterium nitratireducens TaxID=1046114 RepID=A0ABZ2I431_9HYPH
MIIPMTSLTRAKNGDWFARKGIPADIRDAYQRAYGVRQEERFRRPAATPAGEAKMAFADWVAELEGRIAALRASDSGDAPALPLRQLRAILGEWYDWFINQQEERELSMEAVDSLFAPIAAIHEQFVVNSESVDGDFELAKGPRYKALLHARLAQASGIEIFLAEAGRALRDEDRHRLLELLEDEFIAALQVLRRRAEGDYGRDTHRLRFPASGAQPVDGRKHCGWNAWEAFEAWVKERNPQASTINRWRGVFEHLNTFTDGKDLTLITDDDAVAWKDKLMGGNASGRTVNEVWLTAARRVFNWVKDQKKIGSNPFDGVKVAVGRTSGTKGEFSEEDVEAILKATLISRSSRTSPYLRAAIRWVPWLCAYTGSRPGEMTQLRKEDIEKHRDGFWMLHIRPEAGTVKGSVSRTVVLHDHLVEQGFIGFVQEARGGPLFYDPKASGSQKRAVDPLNPVRPMYVQVRQKLADWVRKLGVTDQGVSPNHGWRHTFKRRAARAKIEQRLRDAFCGHSSGNVGSIYERPSVEDLAEAIKDFPRYPVDTSKIAL